MIRVKDRNIKKHSLKESGSYSTVNSDKMMGELADVLGGYLHKDISVMGEGYYYTVGGTVYIVEFAYIGDGLYTFNFDASDNGKLVSIDRHPNSSFFTKAVQTINLNGWDAKGMAWVVAQMIDGTYSESQEEDDSQDDIEIEDDNDNKVLDFTDLSDEESPEEVYGMAARVMPRRESWDRRRTRFTEGKKKFEWLADYFRTEPSVMAEIKAGKLSVDENLFNGANKYYQDAHPGKSVSGFDRDKFPGLVTQALSAIGANGVVQANALGQGGEGSVDASASLNLAPVISGYEPIPEDIQEAMGIQLENDNLIATFGKIEDAIVALATDDRTYSSAPFVFISGTPGIGKTYRVRQMLDECGAMVHIVEGTFTGGYPAFFNIINEYKDDSIIVFDDCDKVFRLPSILDAMKPLLDNSKTRVINSAEDKKGTPVTVTSKFIFITNKKRTDFGPEWDAFFSRGSGNCIEVWSPWEDVVDLVASSVDHVCTFASMEDKKNVLDFALRVGRSRYQIAKQGRNLGVFNFRTFDACMRCIRHLEDKGKIKNTSDPTTSALWHSAVMDAMDFAIKHDDEIKAGTVSVK